MPTAAPRRCSDEGAEVRVVAEAHRYVEREGGQHDRAERHVKPPQVRRLPDQPVVAAHHAGDSDADAEHRRVRGSPRHDVSDQRGHGRAHLPGLRVLRDRRLGALPDASAQPDPGDHRAIDAEVHGHDVRSLLGHPDPGRRAARAAPSGHRHRLLGQAERLELGDQAGDRAAVEPHQAGQLSAGQLPGAVHVAQEGAEVVASDGLLVGAGAAASGGGHSYTPAAERRRREIASTLAASSSTPPVTRKLM